MLFVAWFFILYFIHINKVLMSIYEKICDFGCGKPAIHVFKSGKYCCSKSCNSCESKRLKDSLSKKGKPLSENCKRKSYESLKGKHPWNYGLTIDTDERVANFQIKLKKMRDNGEVIHRKHQTEKTKEKLSKIAKDRGLGGYQKKSGRGKWGWYKGFWCDSSYELAYVIYNLDHNIVAPAIEGINLLRS